MSNLPEEMITNILSRLPVKPLLQFKSVCKSWYSLINDPIFIKMHLKHATRNNNLNAMYFDASNIYTTDYDTLLTEAIEVNFPFKSSKTVVDYYGSCNGLVCLDVNSNIVIWNPSTKEFKKLPLSCEVFSKRAKGSVATLLSGFGYDPNLDDYKVVKAMQYSNGNDFVGSEFEVYSLEKDSWRKVDGAPYYICGGNSLFGFENPHWLAMTGRWTFESKCIVYFDLVEEKFYEIQHPDCVNNLMKVGLLGGSLYILDDNETWSDIWVMKDYGVKGLWNKLFTISHTCQYFRILRFSENGKVLFGPINQDLVLYDPELEKAKYLEVHGISKMCCAEVYVGSLVSLKTGTYVGQEQAKRDSIRTTGLKRRFDAEGAEQAEYMGAAEQK
ncbi:hypothetical protein IFM89_030603 [Coptis chinensis]|uniref:F-box domain-containing protein n=1 Tax=Coptis chinensis TaxID=261450 RepID=A0A835HNH1_9MAGN|nr:hypothetical protein IFM89_030603 [Coptis chinensis]